MMGPLLEIGSGEIGKYLNMPATTRTDIVRYPGIDVQCDAMELPFKDESFGAVFMVDAFHHLERPSLPEFYRILKPKGRLIMVEPFCSRLSYWVYGYFHHEKFQNLIGHAYLIHQWDNIMQIFKGRLVPTDFIIYPLSGGFSYPCLVPLWAYPYLEILERKLKPLAKWLAWRMMVVLEKI